MSITISYMLYMSSYMFMKGSNTAYKISYMIYKMCCILYKISYLYNISDIIRYLI